MLRTATYHGCEKLLPSFVYTTNIFVIGALIFYLWILYSHSGSYGVLQVELNEVHFQKLGSQLQLSPSGELLSLPLSLSNDQNNSHDSSDIG